MCGIFGIIIQSGASIKPADMSRALRSLAISSMERGKDSSGIVFRDAATQTFEVIKGDIASEQLLRTSKYRQISQRAFQSLAQEGPLVVMGHARLVTNGSQLQQENNQPVIKQGTIVIHNGIIVNADSLWKESPHLRREYKIDTEIIPSLIRHELALGSSLPSAVKTTLTKIEGTASCAVVFDDRDELALFSNNGSLYYILTEKYFLFASESFFLHRVSETVFSDKGKVQKLQPWSLLVATFSSSETKIYDLKTEKLTAYEAKRVPFKINTHTCKGRNNQEKVVDTSKFDDIATENRLRSLLQFNLERIAQLRRCTRCVLPSTFPFIDFDSDGVCNYCHNYQSRPQVQSLADLKEIVKPFRSRDGGADCLVPFSGGRDSTFVLHFAKKELGLNPIAFTYDWGMVTDLARRNIARVCAKLEIENIIVAADIQWKRENIRKNVEAWLAKPNLGMVPIFMAGDKYFFYYANKVKERNGITLNLFGVNDFENSDFKIGFAGIKPNFNKKRIYSLSNTQKLQLFKFVGTQYLRSPGYFNQSLVDTAGSFVARYLTSKKGYLQLFDYVKWDEKLVENVLKEYDWETATDTNSTWRIGDGTASFYNYIYYTVAGFSEFDTFRSNQIRAGMLDRHKALELVHHENQPRYETLRWYLEIIGLDFESTIMRINAIPKLY